MTVPLALAQSASTFLTILARLVGLAVVAGLLAATVALVYRAYVRESVPSGLALLVALSGVAVVLNTTPLLAAEIAADGETLEVVDALFNIAAFVGSGAGAFAGIRVGDHMGTDVFAVSGAGGRDSEVSEIIQTVGRVTRVQLPDDIDDIVGYDPVPEATKADLAGRRFLFPRRLTKTELRDRLISRLRTDYGIGHVDVELADDGTVEFLAVGSRAAGIGPTLPPATNAVAIRADPAHAASAGDLVQIWETDPMERVLTGELRGVAGDVVTVAIDAADTPKLDPTQRYKLVTLPVQDRPDREFASLLRAADETLGTITVEAGSGLAGLTLDALDVTVAAITRGDTQPEPLPAQSRMLQAGDVVYVIATPDMLRKVENAARGPEGGVSDDLIPDEDDGSSSPDAAGPETSTADSTVIDSDTDVSTTPGGRTDDNVGTNGHDPTATDGSTDDATVGEDDGLAESFVDEGDTSEESVEDTDDERER